MRTSFLIATISTIFLLGLVGYAQWPTEDIPPMQPVALLPAKKTMKPFRSERELANYFRELAEKQKRRAEKQVAAQSADMKYDSGLMAESATPAKPATLAKAGESITNTQEAGVDEGGIVKLHGDHLVVLRRGRLFTVKVGDGALQPISSVDAFGPEINPNSTWYDEMLVSDDTIAVIGYSYERGGTEVGLFHIDDFGKLA